MSVLTHRTHQRSKELRHHFSENENLLVRIKLKRLEEVMGLSSEEIILEALDLLAIRVDEDRLRGFISLTGINFLDE